jgi:ribosomal peptide maturation radical SAM protein 1
MSAQATAIRGKVLLVSAPWALFNRPSLPLGVLKAYLAVNLPGIQVASSHLFLMVAQALGYGPYQEVSRRVWRAESVFSALLYPERAATAESLFAGTFTKGEAISCNFKELVHQVKTVSDRWLQRLDWSALDLVGFTISFCQVTASLYLISQIKRICPSLPVVVGGSSFSGERSAGLLNAFSGIDYLVRGEGERPLTDLLRILLSPDEKRSTTTLPASVLTAQEKNSGPQRFCQLDRLDGLPVPDYDDYFKLLAGFPTAQRFFPTLSVEASRGCGWHRSDRSGRFNGCSFCNLNLQWQGYRTKPPRQVIREVDQLVQRYRVLSLAFADNAFPLNRAGAIVEGIANLGCDLSIFAELRASTPPALLQKMHLAGVDTVQIGIEALSSRLLAKMNKGLRVIDNLSMMKHCEAAGITSASNLMLHFPSSDAHDVDETLGTLDFTRWYRPLKTVSFWLGLESPVYRFPDRFHIRATFNHPNLKKLFPTPLANAMHFIIQGYRGDRTRQRQLWRPVETKARQWEIDYAVLQRQTGGRPALLLRDGGHFLIIHQHFPDQPTVNHRLTGISAEIYRYCSIPRDLDQVTGLSVNHRRKAIQTFLKTMVDKRLMFEEQNCYLSLAIPATWQP